MSALSLQKVLQRPTVPANPTLFFTKDTNGHANVEMYNAAGNRPVKALREIVLSGPKALYQNTPGTSVQGTYTIQNYDSFTTYTVSVSGGSVSRSGKVITVTSPTTVGDIYLNVNGEYSKIKILAASVLPPTITYPLSGLDWMMTSFTGVATAFTLSSGSDTFKSIQWQVSDTIDFENILFTGSSTASATSFSVSGLAYGVIYKLRIRHEGNSKGYSEWSDVVEISTRLAGLQTNETAKFLPRSTLANNAYGEHIAYSADGNLLVIGSPNENGNAVGSGKVDLFYNDGVSWVYQGAVYPADGLTTSSFGSSIALNAEATVMAVGDVTANSGGSGAVYMYEKISDVWTLRDKILSNIGLTTDKFGYRVALDETGDRLAVTCYGAATNTGQVHLFKRSGNDWAQQTILTPTPAETNDYFGSDIALNQAGDVLLIGAKGDKTGANIHGMAYVYTRAVEVWTLKHQLIAPTPLTGDNFGWSVATDASGDWLFVGGYARKSAAIATGTVCIYKRVGSGWIFFVEIGNPEALANGWFGYSVSVDGDGRRLVIGARAVNSNMGAIYLYELTDGVIWSYIGKKVSLAIVASDFLGTEVRISLDGKRIAVGATGQDTKASNAGCVYVFS